MRRDQRQLDYVNLWYKGRVFLVVARILGILGAGVVFLGYFSATAIDPALGVPYLEVTFGLLALAIPVLIAWGIWQAFRKRPDPLKGWAPPGALGNPPEPWFNSDGERLWVRHGDVWIKVLVPQRNK